MTMRAVLPDCYEWSWFSEEKRLDFNGHVVIEAGDRVVIDPPVLTPEDRTFLERLGPVTAIVLTNRDHVREAAALRDAWGVPVWAPAADAPEMGMPVDRLYGGGALLPGGFVAIGVPHGKSPGESALWCAARRVLIVGDAVIGRPPGAFTMLPDEKFADPRKAREGVGVLLDERYVYDAVLVGDGASITVGGRAALERVTSRPSREE